jgi:hypothetical protein
VSVVKNFDQSRFAKCCGQLEDKMTEVTYKVCSKIWAMIKKLCKVFAKVLARKYRNLLVLALNLFTKWLTLKRQVHSLCDWAPRRVMITPILILPKRGYHPSIAWKPT